tara:strand:+ start:1001 stop:1993 length:993 start_codon:yes stop_codon:yes gene_type:complete
MDKLDFWLTSGWHLLKKDSNGKLIPTKDFMKAYFSRPEVEIIDESCEAERKLNKKLLEDPFRSVSEKELNQIVDSDVKFNYQMILNFRDFLSKSNNLEEAYLKFCRGEKINFPPLFLDQLVQNILRNIMDIEPIALQVRASEIFFRSQIVNVAEDEIMLADEEMVNFHAKNLQNEKNTNKEQNVDIDILRESSADNYWERSDRFDTSIDIAFTKPALDGLARVIEKWIYHFLMINVSVSPLQKIEDEKWSWHIGLDSESSNILNKLYNGNEMSESELKQILCLFKLESEEGFIKEMQNKPVYLALSMNNDSIVKCKPQNLLTNLPLSNYS